MHSAPTLVGAIATASRVTPFHKLSAAALSNFRSRPSFPGRNASATIIGRPAPSGEAQEAREMLAVRGRQRVNPGIDRLVRHLAATLVGKVSFRSSGNLVGRPITRQIAPHKLSDLGPIQLPRQLATESPLTRPLV